MISEEAAQVTQALRSEGVEVDELEGQPGSWITFFKLSDATNPIPVLLSLSEAGGYFVCFSPIRSDLLKVTLNNLKAERVRMLLRLSSEVRMSKLEYQEYEGKPFYYAVSECALDGYNGVKLKNRLEACASLSALIAKQLEGSK
jgi:hypothetical protein